MLRLTFYDVHCTEYLQYPGWDSILLFSYEGGIVQLQQRHHNFAARNTLGGSSKHTRSSRCRAHGWSSKVGPSQ